MEKNSKYNIYYLFNRNCLYHHQQPKHNEETIYADKRTKFSF